MQVLRRFLVLVVCVAGASANAATYTGKLSSYRVYSNASGDNVSVSAGIWSNLHAYEGQAALLREAFLRELTVTLDFSSVPCAPTPVCFQINIVTIKAADLQAPGQAPGHPLLH